MIRINKRSDKIIKYISVFKGKTYNETLDYLIELSLKNKDIKKLFENELNKTGFQKD